MVLQKRSGLMIGTMSKLAITPRLVITLMLYMVVSLFLVMALLAAPWLVIACALLDALGFDYRRVASRCVAERLDSAAETKQEASRGDGNKGSKEKQKTADEEWILSAVFDCGIVRRQVCAWPAGSRLRE